MFHPTQLSWSLSEKKKITAIPHTTFTFVCSQASAYESNRKLHRKRKYVPLLTYFCSRFKTRCINGGRCDADSFSRIYRVSMLAEATLRAWSSTLPFVPWKQKLQCQVFSLSERFYCVWRQYTDCWGGQKLKLEYFYSLPMIVSWTVNVLHLKTFDGGLDQADQSFRHYLCHNMTSESSRLKSNEKGIIDFPRKISCLLIIWALYFK